MADRRPPSHVRRNRAFWDADADAYQERHGGALAGGATAWGVWRIPEAELGVLGDVRGRDVLELGCGAAQWTAALAQAGARAVGLDVSGAQLAHARAAAGGPPLALVQADAERVPFADASFDVVFGDHGAMSFCDPRRTVPEVARVLRPGGTLAFCSATALHALTWDRARQVQSECLHADWFGMGRFDWGGGTVDFHLGYGEWIRLFRRHGLEVEDLVELRAPPRRRARTTFDEFVPHAWARRWPAEEIWRLRRR